MNTLPSGGGGIYGGMESYGLRLVVHDSRSDVSHRGQLYTTHFDPIVQYVG